METQIFPAAAIQAENSWQPFQTTFAKGDFIRPLASADGVGDRLRLVAFAEVQARDAFRSGAKRFAGVAPEAWINDWERFAAVEERHANLLLARMEELGVAIGERKISAKLTKLCEAAEDPVLFLFLLSSAEERGMEAGQILGEQMKGVDEKSAAIFKQIAEEEVEHVAMATEALKGYNVEELRAKARELNNRIFPR